MIRAATIDDIPALVEMGREFHSMSGMACGFDSAAFSQMLKNMIVDDGAAVFRGEGGFIGGVVTPAYLDPSWKMAVELFWWSSGGEGVRLLTAFEDWSQLMAVDEIRMTTLASNPRPTTVIGRRGYDAAEISHMRVM